MIETPRAALLADQIAEVADFLLVRDDDLTQMTSASAADDRRGQDDGRY